MSKDWILNELSVDKRYLKIHNPTYLIYIMQLLIFTDVSWIITILILSYFACLIIQRIRIV